ncbi:TPA: hypothetical protein ACMEKO_005426 [Klebsiella quasipneumoniae subsp. quasipneumoniae]|nr:hypothetical protein [Klebsiella variicola subsp. variicola]HBZ7348399.1 hypothetical protein [Klebsiella variicola subsp. variicola]HDY9393189.1 hypothetical protein [Klebsiella pneumoniae]
MTRLAVLTITSILSFSANALSDQMMDMQKTYSMFTSQDNVEYDAAGLVQQVWYRFSDNAEVTTATGSSERLRLQINGTPVKADESNMSQEALIPSGMIIEVLEGTLYCNEMATSGCQVNIKVGSENSITTRAKVGANTNGKVLIIDSETTKRVIQNIQKVSKSNINNKHIYLEAPLFVVGNKEFRFGLIETPLRAN